jgi:hypothetical protein
VSRSLSGLVQRHGIRTESERKPFSLHHLTTHQLDEHCSPSMIPMCSINLPTVQTGPYYLPGLARKRSSNGFFWSCDNFEQSHDRHLPGPGVFARHRDAAIMIRGLCFHNKIIVFSMPLQAHSRNVFFACRTSTAPNRINYISITYFLIGSAVKFSTCVPCMDTMDCIYGLFDPACPPTLSSFRGNHDRPDPDHI